MLATTKTLNSLLGTFDIYLDDESLYLEYALRHVADDLAPLPLSSPLYPAWYKLLHVFQPDPIKLYFFDWYLLDFTLPVLLYALARRSGASLGAAAAVAIAWSFSGAVMTWPYVSKFATLLLACAALAATYVKDRRLAAGITVLGMALAARARAELATPALAFGAIVALWSLVALARSLRAPAHRRLRRKRLALLLAIALAAGVPVGLSKIFDDVETGNRSFFAFQQHYALNVIEESDLHIDPWTNWFPFTSKAFPTATSIGEAAKENPSRFAWHVERNLVGEALTIRGKLLHPLPYIPHSILVLTRWTLEIILAFGLFALIFRRRRLDRRLVAWLPLLAAVAVPTAGATLLIYPREHYLLPFLWLALATLAGASGAVRRPDWLLARYWLRLPRFRAGHAPVVAAIIFAIALFPARTASRLSILKPIGPPPNDSLPNIRTIKVLRQLNIQGEAVILEPDRTRGVYANLEYERITPAGKTEPFWDFLHRYRGNVIIINDRLRWDTRFMDDPQWKAFVHRQGPLEDFQFFPVAQTNVVVAVRRAILPHG
jgi:hypothetical protein